MGGQRMGGGRPPSNLLCFLDCTTPAVETHILPKVSRLLPVKFLPLMFLNGASAPGHELRRSVKYWEFQICHLLVSLHRLVLRRRCLFFLLLNLFTDGCIIILPFLSDVTSTLSPYVRIYENFASMKFYLFRPA
jgi:hypothetical protein